ncbi:hypothetical protein ACPUEK_16060 [Marinomonas gallaica]|uniref:hypothetical protein n=1 Tax=Marinomonas gallaica TaxID=1806667 RepID=UPI003CE4DEB3
MSEVHPYIKTLYPGRALIVLDEEQHPLFRLKIIDRELTVRGQCNTIEISTSVMGGGAGRHKRECLDGHAFQLGQMLIRCEHSTNHAQAVKLVFVEKPSAFIVLPDVVAKQAAGM